MSECNGFRIDTEGAEILRREKRFSDKFSRLYNELCKRKIHRR